MNLIPINSTKSLLIVTAIIEIGTGLPLLIAPSLTAKLLLGAGLGSPESILVGRIAGAALLSIGLTCWLERNRDNGASARGLVSGLLVYNAVAAALLVYAAAVEGMSGVGIWPACAMHSALFIWCIARLRASS